jgi:endonuclease G
MSVVQVGLFTGGLVLGAGGALLLRPSTSQAHIGQQSAGVVPSPPTTLPSPNRGQVVVDGSLSPSDRSLLGPGGHPGPISDFLRHAAYISSYDRKMRHPHWTAEHLTAASLMKSEDPAGRPDRKNSVFREDERIPALFRARMADYFRSGYGERQKRLLMFLSIYSLDCSSL